VPGLPELTRDASGARALDLATRLLQRARLADAAAGVWEAADLQWWSRRPRPSDALPQRFWLQDGEPVAAALLTWWPHAWGLDLLVVPGAGVEVDAVWQHGLRVLDDVDAVVVESLVDVADEVAVARLRASGFVAGEPSGSLRGRPSDLAPVRPLPEGYVLTDRRVRADAPHPMVGRNGPEVADRLARCSLYDPALDLAVLAPDRSVAGYALLWHDPVTRVGLVEPVRVEDEHSGRGVARAMVGTGLRRLVDRGATCLRIGWETDRAHGLYRSLGLHDAVSQVTYRRTTAH
jgi:GNAT superfamily N-acetyltransferase